MARRPQQPNASLVASARRIDLTASRNAAAPPNEADWQREAWSYFRLVPEIKQSIRYRAAQVSKVRLYVAVANPEDPDGEPVPVSDEASGIPPEAAAAAEAELARLQSSQGGQADIMRTLDMCLEVVGEAYIVGFGEVPASLDGSVPAQPEDWTVRSRSEVIVVSAPGPGRPGRYAIKAGRADTKGRPLDPERDTIIRVWMSDPEWKGEADCSMQALLGDCRALEVLQQQVLAHANRALSAGFLTVPNELSFGPPNPTTPTSDQESGDPLDETLAAVLLAPIADPSAAASVQPGVIRGPAQYLTPESLRRITFYDADVVADVESRIEKRVSRIARGLNLPVEKVMGLEQTTFSNAAQVDRDEYDDYLQPAVQVCTDAITYAFLRPQLAEGPAANYAEAMFVAADPSALISTPDPAEGATEGLTLGTISEDSWRKSKGFSKDDAPAPGERLTRAALYRGILTADLTAELLQALAAEAGVDLPIPPAGTPQTGAIGAAAQLLQLISAESTDVPGTAPPPFPSGVTAAAPSPRNEFGRRLVGIDRDLRTRLLVASTAAMTRALERANSRLRSRTNGTPLRARLSGAEPTRFFAILGRTLVAEALGNADPLEGAWDALQEQFMTWGSSAQADALNIASEVAAGFSVAERSSLQLRQAADLAEAWAWMRGALDRVAAERLFDPDPALPALGELDLTLTVPPGLVRQAIARAGGASGLATGGSDAWVALVDAGTRPAGGIGTGELVRGALRDAGAGVEGYVWRYGPAHRARPFEPHMALDGVTFVNFDDPVLANPDSFPETAFYMPGDHSGCICDAEPVILAVGEVAA